MANKTVEITAVVKEKDAQASAAKTFKGTATLVAELPALPADAATKTYALQAVNGVLTWVQVTE